MAVNQKLIETKIKRVLDRQAKKTDNPHQARQELARELAEIIADAIKSAEVTVNPGQQVQIGTGFGRTVGFGKGRVK